MKRALPVLSLAIVAGVTAFVALPAASQPSAAAPCVRPADNASTRLVLDYVDCMAGVVPTPVPSHRRPPRHRRQPPR